MNTGKLYINEDERFYILYDNGKEGGGLHCGEVIDLFINGTWENGRVEYNDNLNTYIFIYASKTTPITPGTRARG